MSIFMSITISKYLSLKTRALPWACPAFCLLQLRHCPSRGHVGLFSLHMPRFSLTLALILLFSGHGDPFLLHMPRFSLTPALTLFSSGHGGLFLLHMPRFSLTLALTLLFSGHDNSFHSPMPLTLFSPQKKIRSINLSMRKSTNSCLANS